MKVLLVSAGAHKEGATSRAILEVESIFRENKTDHDVFYLSTDAISPCSGCNACRKGMPCIHNDKATELAAICKNYDGFLFFTPVHFAGASGGLISALGRIFYQAKSSMQYKPASAVAVSRRGGNVTALDEINRFFQFNNMPIISSNYPAIIHGRSFEEVGKDAEGLQTLRILARNITWVLKMIEASSLLGIHHPDLEEKILTSYIR